MIRPLWVSVFTLFVVSVPYVYGQNPAPTPRNVLIGVLAELNSANLQDATLTGHMEFIAGKTDETGTFTAKTAVNGYHRIQFDLDTASRTDTRNVHDGRTQGTWHNAQGVEHAVVEHNHLVDHSWFFPSIALARLLQSSHAAFSFVGVETKDGVSVEHYTMNDGARPDGTLPNPKLAHLQQIDIYLDSQTMRPAILAFNLHPDSNALVDIPIEVRYSSYAQINGVWIPTHVQRYINSTLNLDLTIQSAEFNNGFPESVAK